MKSNYEAESRIIVIDLRSPGPSEFAHRVIEHDPNDPTFEVVTLNAALDKKFPKADYDNVKLVVFIEDAQKSRDQKTIDNIMQLFKNANRWMTHKSWKDAQGYVSTSEEIYFDNKKVSSGGTSGGITNENEIWNLRAQAMGAAEVKQSHYDFQSAESEFKELFMAKQNNKGDYQEKLDLFIDKFAKNLGRYAFQDNLIPRLLHALKNEPTIDQQQAKKILSGINRDYFTSFTQEGFSRQAVAEMQKLHPDYAPKYSSPPLTVEPAPVGESKKESPRSFERAAPTAGLKKFERTPVKPAETAPEPSVAAAAKAPEKPKPAEPKKGGIPHAFKSALNKLRGKEPDDEPKGPKQ